MSEPYRYIGVQPRTVLRIDEIFTIFYFEFVKDYQGLFETHDFGEMVYVDRGAVTVQAGEEKTALSKGEAFFIAPNVTHIIKTSGDFANVFIISYRLIGKETDCLINRKTVLGKEERRLISLILAQNKQTVLGPVAFENYTQLFIKGNAPFGGTQLIQLWMEQLLIQIIQGSKPVPFTEISKPENATIENIIHILQQNLHRPLTLEDICKQIVYSKSYVEKNFRQEMGISIIRYFNLLKINEAKKMISEDKYTFSEIAETLGFQSLHYFSRSFRKIVGMTPSDYRHSVKSEEVL